MKELLLGYEVDNDSLGTHALEIARHVRSKGEAKWLACLNPHSYVVSLRDAHFATALRSATWLIPDGIGVVHASSLLGGRIRERVTGFDIFTAVHDALVDAGGGSVFFLGASEATLAHISSRFTADYPTLRLAGVYSPPYREQFSEEETLLMCRAINNSRPDVVWVGMTAPKQELWISDNLSKLDTPFLAAIGAVFDFYAGKVKRSAPIFQRLGLEWLPRLLQQPRRLWKRTFVSAPIFIGHVLQERWRRR